MCLCNDRVTHCICVSSQRCGLWQWHCHRWPHCGQQSCCILQFSAYSSVKPPIKPKARGLNSLFKQRSSLSPCNLFVLFITESMHGYWSIVHQFRWKAVSLTFWRQTVELQFTLIQKRKQKSFNSICQWYQPEVNVFFSAVKRLIASKISCVYIIYSKYVCCVYLLCIYKYTHMHVHVSEK